jgi:riboflavin biosynthesis pyrimidine reductase
VRSVVCEGGPALNDTLLKDRLVDELFFSLAPKLAGGEPLTMTAGLALDPPLELELVWALESESHLFLRYRVL